MANISTLYTAFSGMNAQRRAMDITGHNVANASTPGYHRQRVELQSMGTRPSSGIFAGTGITTYGVDVIGVSRSYDVLLEARATREEAGRSATNLLSSTLARIEGIFPEPTDFGIARQLDAFWGAWSDLANQPGALSARTQMLESTTTLTTSLRRTASDLTALRTTAIERVASLAIDANDLATQIAALNERIVANPEAALDLLDQRDTLVTSLASLTGATSRPAPGGQVDVYIGGRAIVSGSVALSLASDAAGTLLWSADNQAVAAPSGEASALAQTITDVVPRYLAALDDVAATLVTQVNAVHVVGYDQGGTTGRNFFDPAGVTATTIALSVDVAGIPANIAAGAPVLPGPTAPGALDGEQARAIAQLADSATGADSKYGALISGLAVETRAATRRTDIQAQIADATRREADSVGAVSIDEEMANLTAAQRAFEASARVLTAVDEMLGILIERTGVVGR